MTKVNGTIYIDLASHEGNMFALLGTSRSWAKQMQVPPPNLLAGLPDEGGFNDLLDAFDREWKGKVTYAFLHDPREQEDDDDE